MHRKFWEGSALFFFLFFFVPMLAIDFSKIFYLSRLTIGNMCSEVIFQAAFQLSTKHSKFVLKIPFGFLGQNSLLKSSRRNTTNLENFCQFQLENSISRNLCCRVAISTFRKHLLLSLRKLGDQGSEGKIALIFTVQIQRRVATMRLAGIQKKLAVKQLAPRPWDCFGANVPCCSQDG